jgi:hypothetical protein
MAKLPIAEKEVVQSIDQFRDRLDVDMAEIIRALDVHYRDGLVEEVLEEYNQHAGEDGDYPEANSLDDMEDWELDECLISIVDAPDNAIIDSVLKERDTVYAYDIDTRGTPTLHRIYGMSETVELDR